MDLWSCILPSMHRLRAQSDERCTWGALLQKRRREAFRVLFVCLHLVWNELRYTNHSPLIPFSNQPLSNETTFSLSISIKRYTILFLSIVQIFLAMWALSSRGGTEAFLSIWSSIVLLLLCIGGTIVMRKFQSSVAVGFFMGSVIAGSQMFLLLFFMWVEDCDVDDCWILESH